MNKALYIILLEKDNYFVYYSDTDCESKLLIEVEYLFDFPKMFHPIKIVETTWTMDLFEIDKYVKKYMMKYGIDHVRGGSYLSPILQDFQLESLRSEFAYLSKSLMITNFTHLHDSIDKFINSGQMIREKEYNLYNEEKMRYFLYHTLHSQNQQNIICYYEKYNNIIQNLHSIQIFYVDKQEYIIDKSILKNVQLLIQNITREPELNNQNCEEIQKDDSISKIYKNTIIYIKHVLRISITDSYSKYNEFIENNDKKIPIIFFSYPHFLLDKFFLHKTTNTIELEQIQDFLYIIEGVFYWITNKQDEYMFDLENIPENIKWKYITALYSV